MAISDWLANFFSHRGKAMRLYKRGMAKADRNDHQGAIEDYTIAIQMTDTPAALRQMVLYNRALVYVAAGDEKKGTDDLEAVLAMEETGANVKTMARQKLARMASRSHKSTPTEPSD